MRKFAVLSGDVDWLAHGGSWFREVGENRYHIVRIDENPDGGKSDRYFVELVEVDLNEIPEQYKAAAWESCGWEGADVAEPRHMMEACFNYGAYAVLDSVSTGNGYRAVRDAKRISYDFEKEPDVWEDRLNAPGNALGSTRREMMQGDFQSGMLRGLAEGNRNAQLVAKMHGVPGEIIVAAASEGTGRSLLAEGHVTFGTLHPNGELTDVRQLAKSDVERCPHFILVPDHYREDGSCRCNDPEAPGMKKAGYRWKEGAWR